VSLAHWPWPAGQRPWPEKKERGREEEDTLTNDQVLIWTAWQGSARAAGQRLPEVVFTMAPPGTPHHRHAQTHQDLRGEAPQAPPRAGEVSRSVAIERQFLSGIQTQISSERRRPAKSFGGDGRGLGGEQLAQGGNGGTRQSRPGSPGDGGVN
jgi:hypothetical protein